MNYFKNYICLKNKYTLKFFKNVYYLKMYTKEFFIKSGFGHLNPPSARELR